MLEKADAFRLEKLAGAVTVVPSLVVGTSVEEEVLSFALVESTRGRKMCRF
jgi:hypothetical protein